MGYERCRSSTKCNKNSIIIKKATFKDKTIGMARAIEDGIYYLIVDVLVDPEYQKNGIGKKLIEEIEKEVENKTKKGQKCSINLVSISGKEEFYEKCGFVRSHKIPNFFTDNYDHPIYEGGVQLIDMVYLQRCL